MVDSRTMEVLFDDADDGDASDPTDHPANATA
jgi:hypothetical protein